MPGHDWTVHQTVAHVLAVARDRYLGLARSGQYRFASSPRELAVLNQAELEAAMAPMLELADELQALTPEMDAWFDANTDDRPTLPFHAFGFMSSTTAQTNWLGELLLHCEDIARAVRTPWELPERDMLLIARGLMEIGPAYVRRGANADASVAVEVPGARPYLIRINHGTCEMRARQPEDRLDAILRVPPSALTQLLYQRIGPLSAVRRGLRIVGGRRPWVALKLMSYFERP